MSRRKKKAAQPLERYSLEVFLYNHPEQLIFDGCKRCLCMMCIYFFDGCRWCSFCLRHQTGACKLCNNFKPLQFRLYDYETHYNFEW